MSDNDKNDKELLERIRDIQEDIKGVPERGINGIIPKLNTLEQRQKDQIKRIRDLENFRDTITGFPKKAKTALYIIGSILGIFMTLSIFWEKIMHIITGGRQ